MDKKVKQAVPVHVNDLVLDPRIDNSISQSLSFYSVAPASPPYPRHLFSPLRTESGGYNLSRELKTRFTKLEANKNNDSDDYTDSLSLERDPLSPMTPMHGDQSISSQSLSEGNSLFKAGDDVSMDFYMHELATKDANEATLSPKSDKSNLKAKLKKFASVSNLSVKYHNMGNWPAESREPRAAVLLVKINEGVIFREAVLEALRSALDVMDKRYWQYCVERIKATEANHTIKSEALVTLRNHLSEAQKHVAVLIAHARSLAIELIEKVKQLRQIHARNVKTKSVVSIFWKDENYLLKIRNDMDFLNESPTIRLWLGFTARELVIPPHTGISSAAGSAAIVQTTNPHDPKAHWLRTYRQAYKEWFKRHEAYIYASWKSGKSKVIFKNDRKFLTGERRGSSARVGDLSPIFTPGFTPEVSRPQTPLSGMPSDSENEHDPKCTAQGKKGVTNNVPPSRAETPVRAAAPEVVSDAAVSVTHSCLGTTTGVESRQEVSPTHSAAAVVTAEAEAASTEGTTVEPAVIIDKEGAEDKVTGDASHADPPADTADDQEIISPPGGGGLSSAHGQDLGLGYDQDSEHLGFEFPLGASTEFDGDFDGRALEVAPPSLEDGGTDQAATSNASLGAERMEDAITQSQEVVGIAMLPTEDSQATLLPTHTLTEAPGAQQSRIESSSVEAVPTAAPAHPTRPKSHPVGNKTEPQAYDPNESSSSTVVHQEVPEWKQLCEYVKHSWGCMDVEQDVNDCNNAFTEYQHGFINQRHGINDSRDSSKYNYTSRDYIQGFNDAKNGITDPVVGFQESLVHQSNKERMTVYLQGKLAAPLFWKTVDHNPLVVEAATGFEECLPSIYLVPPMPADLLSRAEKCSHLLRREFEAEQAIIAQRTACAQQKDAILPHVTADTFSLLETEEHMQRSVEDGAMLRLRQQGNSELLTGVSINHLSSSLSLDAGSLSSLLVPSTSQVLAQQRHTESVQLEQSADNVFLTNTLEQGDSQQLFAKAANESTLLPNVQSFGSYVDTSGFNFFRIEESSKLRLRIEEKITEARKIVEYKPGDLFPTIRPDKRGLREPDHDSIQWQTRHIIKVQKKVRGFLARRRVLKMRAMAKFRSSAHKVRTLVIGFMWRYRQRQKYWEARFEAFLMRKLAVKKFRASMTLAALFRKIVRARRQMREDDERQRLLREGTLTTDKLTPHARGRLSMTVAQTPITRNVRRRHAQKLAEENEAVHADSPHAATNQASPVRSRGRSHSRSKSPDRTKHVTISTEVTEFAKPTTPAPLTPTALSIPEPSLQQSAFSPPVTKLTPHERQRQLELPGPYDESKRREQLKNDALNLVARVNRGKVQTDTLHVSRLIPMQAVPNLPNSHAKMRKFSAKEYAFLNIPSQAPPQSLIKSSSDVFVGPIPKRIPSTTKPRLETTHSAESMRVDASSTNTSVSGGNHSTASTAERSAGHYPGITLPRGGSFSAFPTPHGSGKLTNAGANVISASAVGLSGSQSASALRSQSSAFGASEGHGGELGNIRASQTISVSAAALSGSQSAAALRSRSSAFGIGDSQNNGSGSGSGDSAYLRGSQSVTSVRSESQHGGGPGSTGGRSGSPASALLRYNSTGLSKRTKKQQEAHDKAEAERLQLRNTLIKYM